MELQEIEELEEYKEMNENRERPRSGISSLIDMRVSIGVLGLAFVQVVAALVFLLSQFSTMTEIKQSLKEIKDKQEPMTLSIPLEHQTVEGILKTIQNILDVQNSLNTRVGALERTSDTLVNRTTSLERNFDNLVNSSQGNAPTRIPRNK